MVLPTRPARRRPRAWPGSRARSSLDVAAAGPNSSGQTREPVQARRLGLSLSDRTSDTDLLHDRRHRRHRARATRRDAAHRGGRPRAERARPGAGAPAGRSRGELRARPATRAV